MAKKDQKSSEFHTSLSNATTARQLVYDKLNKIKGMKKVVPALGVTATPPDWVVNVLLQVAKVYFPGVKIDKTTRCTALVMGAIMGHEMAMAKQMTPDRVAILHKMATGGKVTPFTGAEKFEARNRGQAMFVETVPAILTAGKEALAGAVNLPPDEMAEFMRGVDVGVKGASFESFKAHYDFTTSVYMILLSNWPAIEKLGSVTELRNWLLERLPEINVGSESRIKKLCSRVGLKLRDRGRPRKAGN